MADTPDTAAVEVVYDTATTLATRIMALDWKARKDWTNEEQADRHGELQEMISLALSPPEGEVPRAWIANDPEGGPYLTWSAEAAAAFPNPTALYAASPVPPLGD